FAPPPPAPPPRALPQPPPARGSQEPLPSVFTGAAELARSRSPEAVVRLEDPPGLARAALRTSLLPGLLGAAAANRSEPALAFFAVGRAFLAAEEDRLGLLARVAARQGGSRADVPGGLRPPQGPR